jgi:hypothetical protein
MNFVPPIIIECQHSGVLSFRELDLTGIGLIQRSEVCLVVMREYKTLFFLVFSVFSVPLW